MSEEKKEVSRSYHTDSSNQTFCTITYNDGSKEIVSSHSLAASRINGIAARNEDVENPNQESQESIEDK